MVTSVLYDQFRALNRDFNRAVGCSGEFQGSIREFRRRHQTLSQSVQNADQFMMINNVAGFCCQIMNVILILYCTIFFRDETVGNSALSALMYVYWLASTLIGLTLTAGQGVVINHVVCVAWNMLQRCHFLTRLTWCYLFKSCMLWALVVTSLTLLRHVLLSTWPSPYKSTIFERKNNRVRKIHRVTHSPSMPGKKYVIVMLWFSHVCCFRVLAFTVGITTTQIDSVFVVSFDGFPY